MNITNKRFQRESKDIPQHMDDIVIPDIEIDAGWPVSDVKTLDDCDDAYAYLMSACAAIEYDIEMEAVKPILQRDDEWAARARCALKYKKAALGIVSVKRGRFNDEKRREVGNVRDRTLLEYIRTHVPNDQFLDWIVASGCNNPISHAGTIIGPTSA